MPLPPQSDCDAPASVAPETLLADGPRMMVTEVVPVWQRHVEASRQAVEQGIGDLLESFSRLCEGVVAIGRQSPDAEAATPGLTDLPTVDARQNEVLTRLLDEVGVTHQRREQLLAQLAETLVQLDTIEADLRDSLPPEAVPVPLQRLDESRATVALLAQQVAADTRADHERQDLALGHARKSLSALAVERAAPEVAECALQSLSARIEKDLERVVLGLQFQDRLNQTLTNVACDMARFTDWMRRNEHASPADAMRWLAELERTYTMQEQRARHHSLPNTPSQGGSVEFF